MNDELKKLRDEAQATIARIDKALANLTEKPTPERPFRRGEPVIMWDDSNARRFIGFFIESKGHGFVVSDNAELLHSLTWIHCAHLPPFIDWELIDGRFRLAAEYDSGIVSVWANSPEIGVKDHYGTVVAVHKRPEADR